MQSHPWKSFIYCINMYDVLLGNPPSLALAFCGAYTMSNSVRMMAHLANLPVSIGLVMRYLSG